MFFEDEHFTYNIYKKVNYFQQNKNDIAILHKYGRSGSGFDILEEGFPSILTSSPIDDP